MRTAKKLASIILAIAMILIMAIPALAAGEDYTITINNATENHTYQAYQVFAGTLNVVDDENVLSNIVWGNGIDGEAFIAALNEVEAFADCTTAEDVAAVLAEANDDSDLVKEFAQIAGSHLATVAATSGEFDAENSRYTIDGLDAGYYLVKDADSSLEGHDAYTRFILKVVSDATVTLKASKPVVEKKVKDVADDTGVITDWQDSADYDIGDSVPFRLVGTLPTTYADYTTYTYIFHDTMSGGLTYNNDAVIYVENEGEERVDITSAFTATAADGVLTFSIDDLKTIASVTSNSKIAVEYSATLNENAVLGSLGNPNEVYLEYSNNPNVGGEGETGETPEDVVIVFTYATVFNKIDGEGNALTGAEFKLKKFVAAEDGADTYNDVTGNWVEKAVVKNEEGTIFTFTGIDDGIYRLTETQTPAGYNSIEPMVFVVTAEHDVLSDNPALTGFSGEEVSGLVTLAAEMSTGIIETEIVNNAGSILPSTGGIGTTLFYIFGALLVVGTGVILFARKRMDSNK